ncbi:conserved hypothetical protein [Tenacibaculum maritimum]|uniref:toll/interleukin-1 receptor domain-containing protein n=1 Tax=Tenacibaculum maritimum TaxID=107401 RepID=UPI0012E6C984|nr:toll/interleukin-1 receptor domain-containing protein [Tenacibaculum maritimum]CAA0248652.1 conserved hypothetical protein [Tenacibaculum maritimum]
MNIISKSELKSFRNTTRLSYKSLNESLREFKAESKYGKITIFLSHKHDEREEVDGTINFLKQFGVEIYVDWLDQDMPKTTNGVTAHRIKQKIKENKKFIFLATERAISSKWCNWELGHGDAEKYLNHIAILPIKNNYSDFSGSEYLQIYPYIYESSSVPGAYFIKYPNGEVKNVISWLKY